MFATKASTLFRFIALVAYLFPNAAFAASWTASVDDRQGLPALSRGGANALSSAFVFWRIDWAWARQEAAFGVLAPFEYAIVWKSRALDFDLTSRIKKLSSRQRVWEFDLNARSTALDVIGGGIVFKFDLDRSLATYWRVLK